MQKIKVKHGVNYSELNPMCEKNHKLKVHHGFVVGIEEKLTCNKCGVKEL